MKDNCFIAIVPSHQRRRIIAIIRCHRHHTVKQSYRDRHNIVVAQSRHRDIDPDLGGALVNNTVLSGFHNNFLKHLILYSGPKCRKTGNIAKLRKEVMALQWVYPTQRGYNVVDSSVSQAVSPCFFYVGATPLKPLNNFIKQCSYEGIAEIFRELRPFWN